MSLNIKDVNGKTREFAISSDAKLISLPGGIEISAEEFEAVITWFHHGGTFGQLNRSQLTSVIFFSNGNMATFSGEGQVLDEQQRSAWELVLVEMVRRGVVTESTVVTRPYREETTIGKLIADGQLSLSPQEREYLAARTLVARNK